MGVDVVIVNWNGGPELVRAVESVQAFGARPIVVDNASTEGSIEDLAERSTVTVIRHESNRGFSTACNTGAAAGNAEVVMLLNPDAEIAGGTADELEAAFEQTGAALLGVTLRDGRGNPVASARRLPRTRDLLADLLRTRAFTMRLGMRLGVRTPTDEQRWPHGDGTTAGWVHGAAVAIQRVDWDALGGMDDEFFLWYEDIDLGARVCKSGGKVGVCQSIAVKHAGGASWGRISRLRRQRLRVHGTFRYARKHLGVASAMTLALAAPAALMVGIMLDLVHFVPALLRRRRSRGAGGDRRT